MSSSIQVAIKVRPLIKREIEENLPIQWTVQDKYIGPLDPELKKRGEVGFSFDHIFDTDTTNYDVFNTVAKPIVEGAVTGFNGTIFAYGQTSSGKTFTMMGTNKILGVIPLAVTHIFDLINKSDREFLLRVSYIEIYNEKVNDLLNVEGTDLKITDDQRTGQAKVNCQEEVVNCPENVLTIVKKGNKNRRIGETNMNERSSRSHNILRITIESRLASADASEAVQVSQLNLVDLAGSERSGQTGAIGTRFKEGTHINMSLSTLGLVIKQLSESQDNSKAFVNFRDSKLTRILRCSLGGNAMTTIICAVTPAAFEETQCTLAFASRAKRIQNKPKVNEELSEAALLKRYARQITKLETELQKANSVNVVAMESKLLEKERANQILADRIELLKNSILCGNSLTEKDNEGAQGMEKRRRTWCGTSGPVPKFSMYHNVVNLPTIEEFENPPECEKEQCTGRGKRGRSIIIKDLDIANQSFQTEFTDFELELIERERERENDRLSIGSESDDDYVIKKRTARAVTFRENVSICSDDRQSLESNGEPKSPEQCHREPKLGETPKVALRRRIKFLMEQYNSLSEENGNLVEFTKLEKQMIVDEEIAKAMTVHNEKLAASEQMFSELNAKYTTLQKHSENTEKLLAESNDHITEYERQMSESTESLRALRREKQALVEELRKLRGGNSTVQSSVINDDENETSSIFENDSYFENMNTSVVQTDSIFAGDTTNNQTSQDLTMYDNTLANMTANTTVTSDVRELKLLAEQLSETVQQLTIENADLSHKLTNEKECADRKEKNLEDTIAELLTKIHAITEEKNLLRNSLSELEKKSERFSGTSSNVVIDNETVGLINNYKDTIASLTAENEELSSSLMDKIEELERAKDLNISPNDHMCVYRELSNNLGERIKLLENENIELSNNLMERIVDYDRIKEQLDAANSTLSSLTSLPQCNKLIEVSMNNSNIMDREITTNIGDILRPTFAANDSNCVNITNQRTNGEVSKDHVFLSIANDDKSICDDNENVVKGASAATDKEFNDPEVGEPTIDELHEKSIDSCDTLRETVARDDTSDAWRIKAEMLAERVNELQRLNIKLKDLKLTNCKQCAHLTDLNDDRRALRNEVRQTSVKVREANMKLRELQEKFDREYAHGELLRTKLNEDFDISVSDSTMNESSILDGTFSVSVVEERVQRLRNELDVLTEQHGKLTNDYNEKCNEIEKLQEAGSREATPSPSSNDSTRVKRKDAKIEKIQIDMEDTKTYLRRLKRDISGVRGALNKFESEKTSLRNEIERLRAEKLELEEKSASIADSSIAREKVVIMKKEIERLREAIDGFDGIKNEVENANEPLENRLRNSEIERAIFAKQISDNDDSADGNEKIEELLIDLARLKEQIETLKNANKELRDGKSALEAEFDFVTSQKIVVEKASDELMRSLNNLEEENSILKSKLEKLRLKNDENDENRLPKIPQNKDSTTVELLKLRINEANDEVKRHVERNAELEERLRKILTSENEVEDLKLQLKNVNESFNEIGAENANLKEQLMKFENSEEHSSVLESLDLRIKEANDEVKRHVERNAELEERLRKILTTENEVEDLKLQLKSVNESFNEIVAENAKLKEKLMKFENSEEHSSVLESLDLRIKEANDEVKRHVERNAELEERLRKILTTENEVEDLKSQLKNVNESFNEIVAENANLKEQLMKFENSEEHSSVLESLNLRIKEANDEVKRHVERNAELEERLRKILTTENEVEDLKLQLKKINESFNEIVAENANLKEQLMKFENSEEHSLVLESLDLRIKEANDEVKRHVERNAELEERLRKILTTENEVEDLKLQLKNVNESFNEIVAENANLKEKLMKFKNSEEHSSVLESLNLRIKDANDEVKRHVERNAELEERLRKILTTENEVEDLKLQLKNVNESFNEIVAENANLKETLMKFENSEEHSSVVESLNLRIKDANDEVKRYVERNAELEERLRKILITENEVDDLQSQLKKVTERLDEIVAKNASLEEKLTKFEKSENDPSRDSKSSLNTEEIAGNERKTCDIDNSYFLETEKTIEALNLSKSSLNNAEIVGNERKTCDIDNSYLLENEKTIEALNLRVREITIELERYAAENVELNNKVMELNEVLEKRSENFVETDSPVISELRKELNSARESIAREIKSLKPTIDCKDFTVSDLFVAFMREIISKEKELMRNLVANSEREKRELKESKRQSDDAEKRAKSWAKELEAENERIQQNLIANGAKNAELNTEISRLTNLLMESNHENEMLKEKMKVLELDFNTLQAELETLTGTKSNATQQENERLIEEALATREMELNSKLRLAAKQYKEKIDDLTSSLEFHKIRNLELTNNFEAIEINEKRLKNIVDTKSAELTMCNTTIERMEKELKNLTDKHEELSRKSDEKSRKIEEITSLLKNKCDMLSEYKTKLETITPEFENLKDQAAERQKRLEIYKKEIECMTNENAKALSSLREKLDSEKIKSSGYRKEFIELTNKNVTLKTELDELRLKCEDLEISNGKMAKSLRNSTSKIRAEQEMKELRDSNETLQSNLDGAANRIIELQETKTQLTNDLAELRRSQEVLLAKNAEMIDTIATLKSIVDDASEMREKYQILATERDSLALEIKKKQSIIEEMQQSYDNCKKENEKLVLQNKELDEEMDDIVNKIHELSGENAVLEDKLYTITTEQESQVIERITNAEIQRLKSQIEELEGQRDRLHYEIGNAIDNANSLTTENHKLREQISHLERRDSSCSNCATADRQKRDSRRRRSRTELFDQKRQIDEVETIAAPEESRCVELENKVRELEIELVTKKGQLAALQVKIISEERPHKEAADELRQMYRAAREKILTQTAELQKLRDLNAKLSTECEKCKNWSENHADKSTQCLPEPLRLRLGTLGCGCDSDYAKNVPESEKLKRAQKFIESLKDVCRKHLNTISRQRREITLLEKRLNNEPLTADEKRQESPASTILE